MKIVKASDLKTGDIITWVDPKFNVVYTAQVAVNAVIHEARAVVKLAWVVDGEHGGIRENSDTIWYAERELTLITSGI